MHAIKKRISNIEHGILNAEAIWQREKLHHSKFHVRYSIFLQEAWQVYFLELPAVEKSAEHLPNFYARKRSLRAGKPALKISACTIAILDSDS
jgi:hypothetical protein